MSETMYAILAILMIATVIIIIFKKWVPAWIAFVFVPIIFCLIAGYSIEETAGFVKSGVSSVLGTAALAMFSMVYFSIVTDAGLFDPMVDKILKSCNNNASVVMVCAALIAHISHIDTGSTSTLLITIPSMLPIFRKMKLDPVYLFMIICQAVGVMNWLPWGSGTLIAANLVGVDSGTLWSTMSPSFFGAIAFNLITAYVYGIFSKHKAYEGTSEAALDSGLVSKTERKVVIDKKYWANLVVTLLVFVGIFEGTFQAYYVFMAGLALACMINYKGVKAMKDALDEYASNSYRITVVMFCSGVLIGVMNNSAMMESMATLIVNLVPETVHHFFGVVSAGIAGTVGMVVNRDTYMYGMVPILISTAEKIGYSPEAVSYISIAIRDAGAFINPTNARFFMCAGMCGVSINRAWKRTIIPIASMMLVELIIAVAFGVVPV